MDSVVFDTSLSEKILFLKSISSDILTPSDARKYFNDLQFIDYCPVLWCKIEPLIISWEKEIVKRSEKNNEVSYEDLCSNNVKTEICNIKSAFNSTKSNQNASFQKTNANNVTDANQKEQNSYLQQTLSLNDIIVNTETYPEETQIFQEQVEFKKVIGNEFDSLLGKRILLEENIINEESKLTKN